MVWWFLVCAQSCAPITTINFRTSSSSRKETLYPPAVIPHFLPPCSTAAMNLLFVYRFTHPGYSYNWNHTVCDPLRLTSFTWHNSLKVHPCGNICRLFVLFMAKYYSILYTGCTTFACLFISWQTSVSIFWLLQIMLLWTFVYKFLCGHMFSVLLSIYLKAELLGHVVTLCLTFWETAKLFSKAAVPFYIPTSNAWAFQPEIRFYLESDPRKHQ